MVAEDQCVMIIMAGTLVATGVIMATMVIMETMVITETMATTEIMVAIMEEMITMAEAEKAVTSSDLLI